MDQDRGRRVRVNQLDLGAGWLTRGFKGTRDNQVTSGPAETFLLMVSLVSLVHLDPSWSAISRVWLHDMDQVGSWCSGSGLGVQAGPWCWVLALERLGPPWSTKKLFPNAPLIFSN